MPLTKIRKRTEEKAIVLSSDSHASFHAALQMTMVISTLSNQTDTSICEARQQFVPLNVPKITRQLPPRSTDKLASAIKSVSVMLEIKFTPMH